MNRRVAVEIAQEKTDKPRQSGEYPRNRPAKWSDRRPEKRNQNSSERKRKDYKRDSKFGRKDKKKYSR
jgi:hypothetical protein